jgi:hypothetical protein
LLVLDLGFNQLTGSIPPELGNLAALRILNLSRNQLSGAIPPELGDLTDLHTLFISRNLLSGSIPAELGNLSGLIALSLYSNDLSGVVPLPVASLGAGIQEIRGVDADCRLDLNPDLSIPDDPDYVDADLDHDGFICGVPLLPPPSLRYVTIDQGEESNNTAPFGGANDQRYQQIYDASAFGVGGQITRVAFFSPGQVTQPLATARYTIRMVATPLSVMTLSHDMDANLAAGAVTVLDATITDLEYDDVLTFELEQPFDYDPSEGNLLMDVTISNAVDEGRPVKVFRAVQNSPITSRRPAYGGVGDGFGLVTRFEIVDP